MSEVTPEPYDPATEPATGSDVVVKHSEEYIRRIIANTFPNIPDGLKRGQIRTLVPLRNVTEFIGSGDAVGKAKKFHDHGDVAIYEAAARMAQVFNLRPPLIDWDGGIGTYSNGGDPSKMRYTKMRISAFAREVFFEGIDFNALPMQRTEDLMGWEPTCLVASVPTSLLTGNFALGFGHQSRLVPLNFTAVCELAIAYIEHQKSNPLRSFPVHLHADKLIPDFPIDNAITNYPELLAAYRRRDFAHPIAVDGSVEIAARQIVVRTLPYGKNFSTAQENIEKQIRYENQRKSDPSNWMESMIQEVMSPGGEESVGRLIIDLKPGVNPFEVWRRLASFLRFSTNIKPIYKFTDDKGRLTELDPLEQLDTWYQRRRRLLLASKRRVLAEKQRANNATEARFIVYNHSEYVGQVAARNDTKTAMEILMSRDPALAPWIADGLPSLSHFQAVVVLDTPIRALTKDSRDALFAQLEREKADIRAYQMTLLQVPDEMIATLQSLKKRYGVARATRLPKYLGNVGVAGGFIQFESTEEIQQILSAFPKGPVAVQLYEAKGHLLWLSSTDRVLESAIPKQGVGEIHSIPFEGENGYTVAIKNGAACAVRGVVPGKRADGFFYVPKRALGITRRGELRQLDVPKDIKLLQSPGRGNNTDLIYVYPTTNTEHYLATANESEPNIITIQRVAPGADRLVMKAGKEEVEIRHSFTGQDWYFSFPEKFINRVTVRAFHIPNVLALLGNERYLRLDIASSAVKRNRNFNILA